MFCHFELFYVDAIERIHHTDELIVLAIQFVLTLTLFLGQFLGN